MNIKENIGSHFHGESVGEGESDKPEWSFVVTLTEILHYMHHNLYGNKFFKPVIFIRLSVNFVKYSQSSGFGNKSVARVRCDFCFSITYL